MAGGRAGTRCAVGMRSRASGVARPQNMTVAYPLPGNETRSLVRNQLTMTTSAVFGITRTHVGPRHALIAPDGHVPSFVPGVEKATAIVLISAEMGARFTHLLLTFTAGGGAACRLRH